MTGQIDFLIIGAEKSGTTWLADMLRQHPRIFIPAEKELFYFNERFFESPELPNFNAEQPVEWFLRYFANAQSDQIKGEASPAYLWDDQAPENIRQFDPHLKLIAVLRNPIERAYSQYLYFIQRGVFADIRFEEAIQRREDILSRGLYARQLERYFDHFPREQMYVTFYDDLREDSEKFLASVQAFLGVPVRIPDNLHQASNVTGVPRFPWLNRAISIVRYPLRKYNPPFLMKLIRRSGLARLQERLRLANTRPFDEKPQLAEATRIQLIETFREDVQRLQEMTGRDLSGWLEKA